MFVSRAVLVTLFFVASFVSLEARRRIRQPEENQPGCPEKCLLAFRCSPYYSEELIWAKVDGICRVFANGCIYATEECHRQNDCKSPPVRSTKEECQKLCASGCDAHPDGPVCGCFPEISPTGAAGEMTREFKNQCALDEWSCKNDKPYGSSNPGHCS